ncbi:unnamed protein product [Cuscuta europaea]|uniref:Uncharacterized protein n=1 Tax=Cuscuta europaea TaxID=41803 RepID=A0A9P0ZQI6_CUSEU|nr:unnamed protein product [Cuscuta europaea]
MYTSGQKGLTSHMGGGQPKNLVTQTKGFAGWSKEGNMGGDGDLINMASNKNEVASSTLICSMRQRGNPHLSLPHFFRPRYTHEEQKPSSSFFPIVEEVLNKEESQEKELRC